MFVFVHRKYKIKRFFLAIAINNNIYVIFWTYYKSKFCNSDKSEKIDKPDIQNRYTKSYNKKILNGITVLFIVNFVSLPF